jgi:NAD-dependent SIR2 family protein deacetylase
MGDNTFTFLFGAGLSLNAGLPSCDELNQTLIFGKNIFRYTSGQFYIKENPTDYEKEQLGLKKHYALLTMLSQCKAEADYYYQLNRLSNYEDWYYLAQQFHDEAMGAFDNPALHAFTSTNRRKFFEIYELAYGELSKMQFHLSLNDLSGYIRDVVLNKIHLASLKPTFNPSYLSWILEALKDSYFSKPNIFTLNYDLLLEKLFEENDIPYCDGFCENSEEPFTRKLWNANLLDNSLNIKLIKLHGSLGWYKHKGSQCFFKTAKYENMPREYAKDCERLVLIGRHNKTLDYSSSVFEDLHYHFSASLKKSNCLVVCGYSFGDKAINTKIINWKIEFPNKKIIVIDPVDPSTNTSAYKLIRDYWEAWKSDQRAIWFSKEAKDITWEEIRTQISANGI